MKKLNIHVVIFLLLVSLTTQVAVSESLARLGEIKRGNVDHFSVISLWDDVKGDGFAQATNQFVIAMRDSQDKLRLMVVEVSDSGQPEVIANMATQGTIKTVSVARVSANRIVTALRDSGDKLRLIAFDISDNGRTIKRLGTTVSRSVREADIAGQGEYTNNSMRNQRVFTTAINTDGELFVADWKVKQNGEFVQLGAKTYGSASHLDVENGSTGSYFMSAAMRDSENSLRLIAFQTPSSNGVKRGGFASGGKIREVKSAGYDFGGKLYTVSISEGPVGVRAGLTPIDRHFVDAGFLKIIHWSHEGDQPGLINNSSNNYTRLNQRELKGGDRTSAKYEGMAETADIMNFYSHIAGFDTHLVTAHAGFGTFKKLRSEDQGKRRLRIISWDENLSVTAKTHIGGHYTQVELAPLSTVGESARFVSVLRGVRGELKIVVWAINH